MRPLLEPQQRLATTTSISQGLFKVQVVINRDNRTSPYSRMGLIPLESCTPERQPNPTLPYPIEHNPTSQFFQRGLGYSLSYTSLLSSVCFGLDCVLCCMVGGVLGHIGRLLLGCCSVAACSAAAVCCSAVIITVPSAA